MLTVSKVAFEYFLADDDDESHDEQIDEDGAFRSTTAWTRAWRYVHRLVDLGHPDDAKREAERVKAPPASERSEGGGAAPVVTARADASAPSGANVRAAGHGSRETESPPRLAWAWQHSHTSLQTHPVERAPQPEGDALTSQLIDATAAKLVVLDAAAFLV